MACVNSSNQNPVVPSVRCNVRPAIFNLNDGSISFVPQPLTRNGPEMEILNPQMIRKEYSSTRYPYFTHGLGTYPRMIQGPHPLTNHLSEREFKMVQDLRFLENSQLEPTPNKATKYNLPQYHLFPIGDKKIQDFHPSTNQLANRSNLIQHSHLLQLPLCSKGEHGNENLHSITGQLTSNELNRHQQSGSLAYQLPGIRNCTIQNSNMVFQQPSRFPNSESLIRHSTEGLLHIESNRNPVINYQQSVREATARRGLQTIFHHPSKVELFTVPYQKIIRNQGSYPSCSFSEIGFNSNRDLPLVQNKLSSFNTSLDSNKYPQYSENVHICVVGPPGCGKADLIRTFARNNTLSIPTGKPFMKVYQQGMVCFGTNLVIDIWHVDDLTLAAEDLKSHCESSKSVLVLVYSMAQQKTLLTVLEWIKFLKHDIVADVPIILVENNINVESSFNSRGFSGDRVQKEYKLDAFYQCSSECVDDVEAVFLFAAHKAFHRKIHSIVR